MRVLRRKMAAVPLALCCMMTATSAGVEDPAPRLKYRTRAEVLEALKQNPAAAIDLLRLRKEYAAAINSCIDDALTTLYRNPRIAKEAKGLLRGALGEQDRNTCRLSAMVLSRIGEHDDAVIAALIEGLLRPESSRFDGMGSRGAARDLAAIGKPAVPALVKARAYGVLGMIGKDAVGAIDFVRKGLGEKESHRRIAAALALYQIGGQAAPSLPVLIDALSHKKWHRRFQAIHALRAFGPDAAPAIEALKERLDDEKGLIRTFAQVALDAIEE